MELRSDFIDFETLFLTSFLGLAVRFVPLEILLINLRLGFVDFMSILLSGFLGLAVRFVPKIFDVLAADREQGDVQTAVADIVRKISRTEDPAEAETRLNDSKELREKLQKELNELERLARDEQENQQREIAKIAQKFLELEEQERELQNQQRKDYLKAELESRMAARDFAKKASGGVDWLVSSMTPILSILILIGFVRTLYFIVTTKTEIQNAEIFFTAIGTLATAFATIIAFHFGSSAGSKFKDELVPSLDPADNIPPPLEKDAALSPVAVARVAQTEKIALEDLPDPGGTFGLFRRKAPGIANDLMSDFGMTLDQACGILGNIGHECAGFQAMQEIKPIVPGSRGGWGWCQWTGPRRRDFEKWCKDNGFTNLSDDNANYGFLKHELETSESRALDHLIATRSLADATRSFMDRFERPGVKHFDSRLDWAREAKRAFRNVSG
ncbi:phage tail tip lysozyme [Ruegeria arenilitoris]|uniref:phage tail tip lysozyme n=1 Tax=Ruegeria arenilitoris TaxID=1173585 RepID=UPI00147F39C3|nr:phage tail tip lysozyme [Ruegeria arenilitoris]